MRPRPRESASSDGDAPGPLGTVEKTLLGVDSVDDALLAGIALADDGKTPVGATLQKLAGATGERIWQTDIVPGFGYTDTWTVALQVGGDDSIFLAGTESAPTHQDAGLRRIYP